jgi:hypothetical protein
MKPVYCWFFLPVLGTAGEKIVVIDRKRQMQRRTGANYSGSLVRLQRISREMIIRSVLCTVIQESPEEDVGGEHMCVLRHSPVYSGAWGVYV